MLCHVVCVVVDSVLKCPNRAAGHIIIADPPDLNIFKRTLPQRSLPNITYVVQIAVNYSCCTPDDGCGKCLKHVE
jgi:hypothetical protein